MTTDSSHPLSRRSFLTQAGAGSVGLAAANLIAAPGDPKKKSEVHGEKWPHEARLAISISMQFEAGGQPDFGADSPFSIAPVPEPYPDLPARTWFKYGYREGIPRLLDLWDKHGIKVTSHMVGGAARKNPQLAKEIVDRGHEAAAHGMTWQPEFAMSREDLKTFISDGVKAVFDATGQQTIGYNANWLHRSVHTLPVLQELGFLYHVDDLSHDEPTLVPVNGQDFVVVPYTIRNNDIMLIEGRHFSSGQFLEQLKHEFDQLYAEGATRRRQMSISTHDRIGGTPAMVRVMDEFLTYAKSHPGIWFARKDEIARFAKQSPLTPRDSEET
ncbi:MAG: polysaccharide deacetylase [Akkermansiaceae bacterium]|nr:polysaccharide deacetylase [Akkermansiaceae bacterium]